MTNAAYAAELPNFKTQWGRRRWLLLAVFITYSLAYVDRANYGFGAAAGMAKTLGITGAKNSLLGALFFLGYFLFQVPGIIAARRFSCTRLIAVALVLWGMLAALTGVLRQFWLLAIDRLLLGVAESIIFPALLLVLTRWFTRADRSRANTLLMLGNPVTVLWMSAITGFLIERFGWQRTFILEGVPSVIWAIVWGLFVREHPTDARWMPKKEAESVTAQLAVEQAELPASAHATTATLAAALLRKDVIVLAIQYFCWSFGVYGFVLWLPTIVRQGASLTMGRTGLVSAAPYLVAIALMLVVSQISDRTRRRREMVWPFLLLSGLALTGSFLLAPHGFVWAYLCLLVAAGGMYAPYGPFFAIMPERIPKNYVGEVMALVNSAGALGAFAGVDVVGWLRAATGSERAGYLMMSAFLVVSSLLIVWLPEASAGGSLEEPVHA
ncbi:MAG TPA: MFS transporter [Candidatus Aquilonibacter sp.]|nr:MFS transporter [Candidatus Aquilonibacter sp.]